MAQAIATTVNSSQATAVVRAFLYVTLTLVLIPVQAGALLLHLPLSKRLPMWYHRVCCRLLGIRLEVFGRRSRVRPTLFVANHTSYLDIARRNSQFFQEQNVDRYMWSCMTYSSIR